MEWINKPTDPTGPWCEARSPRGYVCTLAPDHESPFHVASTGFHEVASVWTDDDE